MIGSKSTKIPKLAHINKILGNNGYNLHKSEQINPELFSFLSNLFFKSSSYTNQIKNLILNFEGKSRISLLYIDIYSILEINSVVINFLISY